MSKTLQIAFDEKSRTMPLTIGAFLVLLAVSFLGARSAAASDFKLLYFFSHGCEYCELWDEEVGSIYHKTDESKTLPLRRVNADEVPKDLARFDNIFFTPTFVVLKGEVEVGRVVGYMGQDFFWGYLNRLVEKAKADTDHRPQKQAISEPKPRS